ncbi:MAG: hypothetical protein J6R47_03575 [Acholeplasmatales bacterium]|nr:hypothetical protein [Acholeplasmatales bacterium]
MVRIYLNGEWQDITNQLLNKIQYDDRVDEVFDSGTFSFESKTIDYNIPPLTLCDIDGLYWACSSECTTIIPTNYHTHDVKLLELTFALHTCIIGSKVFSNKGKYPKHNDKINILVELANQKNTMLFGVYGDKYVIKPLKEEKNIEREFPFGPGTSLFQCLLQIGKSVDAIPRITNVSFGSFYKTYYVDWDYLDDNNLFTLDEKRILGIKYYQDVENYTKVLEAEITNIVDRDTINVVKNLTVRSEDAIINSDNQVLLLPSNAEEIVDIELVGDNYLVDSIDINGLKASAFQSAVQSDLTHGQNNVYLGNYHKWSVVKNTILNANILEKVINVLNENNIPIFDDIYFYLRVTDANNRVYALEGSNIPTQSGYYSTIPFTFSLNNYLLEENEWNSSLDISEKSEYMHYKTGTNKIQGLYDKYKDTLWDNILQNTRGPVIRKFFADKEIHVSLTDFSILTNYTTMKTRFGNPLYYSMFNVSYKPVVDTFVKSDNTKLPFNENEIKPTSRSFEASSSITDFNLLIPSMNKTNEMLGMPEVTISYLGNNYPKPSNLIIIKGQNYYVSSVQTTITNDNYVSYINLVNSFTKIAEVFGVASQYESTKVPLTGIIDRYIYGGELKNSNNYDPTGIILATTDYTCYKRGVKVSYENSTYFIIKADDNYSFASGMVENSNLITGNFENKLYSYVDEWHEQDKLTIFLVKESESLTLEQSRDLPNLRDYTLITHKELKLYKDARERLIFVFKLT